MKILHIIPCYLPAYRYGGPVASVHGLSQALVKSGGDVTVFTTNADGDQTLDVPIDQECWLDGVKVFYFKVQRPFSYFYSAGLRRALKKRLHEFDLVHIHWLYVYPTLVAARECLKQGVPYFLAPRGMLDSNAIHMKGFYKKKLYLKLVERSHLYGARGLHYTSQGEMKQSIVAKQSIPSFVVNNGLDLDKYNNINPLNSFDEQFPEIKDKKNVLFLGRINYIKGLDLLATAWKMVIKEIPDAHLIIAGPDNDDYKKKIVAQLQDDKVLSNTTFTGLLSDAEKISAFRRVQVFVAPSYLESFGMSIIEAMASKKPVVVTDRVNIYPEIVDCDAGIVTSCNSEDIANALITLLKDPKKAKIMGSNGYNLVKEKFDWQLIAADMKKLYMNHDN